MKNSDTILFYIAFMSPWTTKYSSIQQEILNFCLFANFFVERLSYFGGRLLISLLEKHSGRYLDEARKQLNTEHTCTRAWGGGSWNDSSHLLESLLLLIYSTGTLEVSASLLYWPPPLRHTELNISYLYFKKLHF